MTAEGRLKGAVPLGSCSRRAGDAAQELSPREPLIQASADEKQDRVTELFDKYNILTLPVLDEEGKLAGVITADDIISVLRRS